MKYPLKDPPKYSLKYSVKYLMKYSIKNSVKYLWWPMVRMSTFRTNQQRNTESSHLVKVDPKTTCVFIQFYLVEVYALLYASGILRGDKLVAIALKGEAYSKNLGLQYITSVSLMF